MRITAFEPIVDSGTGRINPSLRTGGHTLARFWVTIAGVLSLWFTACLASGNAQTNPNAGWRFASVTGNSGSVSNGLATNILIFMSAAGEAYIDDVSLVPLSGPGAGTNILINGDFEGPLSGTWTIPVSMGGSGPSTTYAHSGSYSLHVVATVGGNVPNSIKQAQALPRLNTNVYCTLSFWFHVVPNGTNINVRGFPGSTLSIAANTQPVDLAPIIAFQPQPLVLPAGLVARFSVSAFGSDPLTFQWLKDSVPLVDGGRIDGALSSTLTINPIHALDTGNYSVIVSNAIGVTNSALAGLTVLGGPPAIASQPQSLNVLAGTNVTFSVTATGGVAFVYQWFFNDGPIASETNSTLILSDVQAAAAGNYTIRITNFAGSVTSSTAVLSVSPSTPIITIQPSTQTVLAGTDVILSVASIGTEPLLYQWSLNNTNLPGAINSVLALSDAQVSETGDYSVAISNSVGSVTSQVAVLTVLPNSGLLRGLVAWWKGDDSAGDVTRLHEGTLINGASFQPGEVNSAFSFNGLSQFVQVPDSPEWAFGTNDFTIELWANFDAFDDRSRALVASDAFGQPAKWIFWIDRGSLTFHINGPNPATDAVSVGTAPLPFLAGRWYHLAVTRTGPTYTFFTNGMIAATASDPANRPVPDANAFLTIGEAEDNNYFDGLLDEVSIFNRALSPSEIGFIYGAGPLGKSAQSIPPVILSQPSDQSVILGHSATFSVTVVSTSQPFYQWYANGTSLPSGTESSLVLSNVQEADVGSYQIVVSSSSGSVTSRVATLVLLPPEITVSGFGIMIQSGAGSSSATDGTDFGHVAQGFPGPTRIFTVRNDGGSTLLLGQVSVPNGFSVVEGLASSLLPGNSDTFTLRLETSDAGYWSGALVFTNNDADENPFSFWITGSVIVPPAITLQPQSQAVDLGTGVAFSVEASGSPPLSYQWLFNNAILANATNSTLTITHAQPGNAGSYSARVSNDGGSVTSSVVSLVVFADAPRTVQIPAVHAVPGGTASLAIQLVGQGNENALGFSLNFDTSLLGYASATKGTNAGSASLNLNTNQLANGELGITLALGAGLSFSAGTQELVLVSFGVSGQAGDISSFVNFGNQPIILEISDFQAHAVPANFNSGLVVIGSGGGYEADVTPFPNGNNAVTATDWVKIGRYVAGLDAVTAGKQFQRADCAPRESFGNGQLTVSDWVQAGRYAAGLDPLVLAAGPDASLLNQAAFGISPHPKAAGGNATNTNPILEVLQNTIQPGETNTIIVQLVAGGTESAVDFSFTFDPLLLSFVRADLSPTLPGGVLNVNASQSSSGRLGFAAAASLGGNFPLGTQEFVRVSFATSMTATGSTSLKFGDQPVFRETSDILANALPTTYVSGNLIVGPKLLRLQPPLLRPGGLVSLLIGNADGSGVSSQRVSKIEVHATTNVGLKSLDWPKLTNAIIWSNGVLRLDHEQKEAPSGRFYRTVESF